MNLTNRTDRRKSHDVNSSTVPLYGIALTTQIIPLLNKSFLSLTRQREDSKEPLLAKKNHDRNQAYRAGIFISIYDTQRRISYQFRIGQSVVEKERTCADVLNKPNVYIWNLKVHTWNKIFSELETVCSRSLLTYIFPTCKLIVLITYV